MPKSSPFSGRTTLVQVPVGTPWRWYLTTACPGATLHLFFGSAAQPAARASATMQILVMVISSEAAPQAEAEHPRRLVTGGAQEVRVQLGHLQGAVGRALGGGVVQGPALLPLGGGQGVALVDLGARLPV